MVIQMASSSGETRKSETPKRFAEFSFNVYKNPPVPLMDTQLSIQTSKKAPEPKATMPVIDLMGMV